VRRIGSRISEQPRERQHVGVTYSNPWQHHPVELSVFALVTAGFSAQQRLTSVVAYEQPQANGHHAAQ
jgi:hypothetical protein